MDLSIIIPCYNEEHRLGKTLERIAEHFQTQTCTYEVIVVDNGFTDATGQIVESYKDKIQNIRLISRRSHGKGWAIKEGMLSATGRYRLFMDADNATDISHVADLMEETKEGYDVVISSRRIKGAIIQNPQSVARQILGRVFAWLVRVIVPLGIKDTQNGFKLFTEKAVTTIFPHQTIYYWAFDVEVLAIAKALRLKIKEVPITWVDDEKSTMRLGGMVRMLMEVIWIRINMSTSTYIKNERRVGERRSEDRRAERRDQDDRRTSNNRLS